MSREGRWLTEQEFDEIVVVLREELEKRLKLLSDEKIIGSDRELSHRLFRLEFNVVSSLYYRLKRHLIDRGTRSHHPEFADSKLVKYLDERGYKYDDAIPFDYRDKP